MNHAQLDDAQTVTGGVTALSAAIEELKKRNVPKDFWWWMEPNLEKLLSLARRLTGRPFVMDGMPVYESGQIVGTVELKPRLKPAHESSVPFLALACELGMEYADVLYLVGVLERSKSVGNIRILNVENTWETAAVLNSTVEQRDRIREFLFRRQVPVIMTLPTEIIDVGYPYEFLVTTEGPPT